MRSIVPKFVRRLWHATRVQRHLHEARVLTAEYESYQRRMDAVLRDLRKAREDLFWVDIDRPPVSHAQGRQRSATTGQVRTTLHDVLAKRDKVAVVPDEARVVHGSPMMAGKQPTGALARRSFQRPKEPKVAGETR